VVKRTLYVLVDGKPEAREVTTGISDGRLTEITGGALKVGETVILSAGGQGANAQRGQGGQRGFRIL
jgi:HlyD family secretion protein